MPPEPVVPIGLYVFRSGGSVDVLWCERGRPPAAQDSLSDEGLDPEHPLVLARRWLDFFWDQATPVGPRATFAVGDCVMIAGDGSAGRVESATAVDDTCLYKVRIAGSMRSVSEEGADRDLHR